MATTNGSARPAADMTGVFDSGLGDVEGGRAAPRLNPEVLVSIAGSNPTAVQAVSFQQFSALFFFRIRLPTSASGFRPRAVAHRGRSSRTMYDALQATFSRDLILPALS